MAGVAKPNKGVPDENEKRRQNILLRARLSDLMSEEETNAKLFEKQVDERWIEILREKKLVELQNEVQIVRHTFEKTLDRKNAVIAMLSVDLQEAEEQYRLALRSHLDNLDSLIDLQNRRMTDLDLQFESALLEMKQDFDKETMEITRKHQLQKADLQLILENMRTEAATEDRSRVVETTEMHQQAHDKLAEDERQMKNDLEAVQTKLRKDINSRFDEFVQKASTQMKEYTEKATEDGKVIDAINEKMLKIAKYQSQISTLKQNVSNNQRECEERNKAMRAEVDSTANHFKELKSRMHQWRKQEERQLADLVSQTRDTKAQLEQRLEKAERILRSVELCRQLETEREKVLGFESDISTVEVQEQVKQAMQQEAQDDEEKRKADFFSKTGTASSTATEEWRLMERFWVKYNKVELDNAAIEQEKFHLQHENGKLRSLLKQYLDGVSVNHDVMSTKNNLLHASAMSSKPRMPGSIGGTAMQRHVPVVEGNKVILEVARQRAY